MGWIACCSGPAFRECLESSVTVTHAVEANDQASRSESRRGRLRSIEDPIQCGPDILI